VPEPLAGIGVSEVGGDDGAVRAVAVLQLPGQLFERGLTPRDEHQVMALPGEDPGELESDACGGAGDEGSGSGGHGRQRGRSPTQVTNSG